MTTPQKATPARTLENVDNDLRGKLALRMVGKSRGEKRDVRNFDDLLDERLTLMQAEAVPDDTPSPTAGNPYPLAMKNRR